MRIVLTGGVTGGHIYPAIAIGDKFRAEDPSCEIIYIASGEPLERSIISKAGYELFEVRCDALYRDNPLHMAATLIRTLKGRKQARQIMKEFKPDVLISTGSYVSVPVVLAAKSLGVRIFLHEQNGFPGVSNKLLSRYAEKVFLGFESAGERFKDQTKVLYSGNPVRSEFSGRDKSADRASLELPEDDFIVMVFGGSLGSATTNAVGEALARKFADKEGFTLIWGTGNDYYDEVKARLDEEGFAPDNVRILPYISDMPEMLSASDLSISRSGALSVAETTMAGRAAIFIPSPNVTEDHQYYNAKAVADAGGAYIVREENGVEPCREAVEEIVEKLYGDRDLLRKMQEASAAAAPVDATGIIYETIVGSDNETADAEEQDTPEEPEITGNPEVAEESEAAAEPAEEESSEKEEPAQEADEITEVETTDAARTIAVSKEDIESAAETSDDGKSDEADGDLESSDEPEPESSEEKEETAHQLSDEDREIAERIRLRKIATEKKRRRQRRGLIATAILIVAALTAFILSFTSIFTVDSIEVKGNSQFSAEEIISMGHAVPGKNLIYHPDKAEIKEYLELNPYIKSAEVSRKLPSTLVINVSERTRMMALKYDDDYLILDRDGILLQKSRTKPKLTLLEGNVISKIKLGESIGTQNEELMKKNIDFVQTMVDNDLYYVKVDLSDALTARAYVYDTLVVRGSYENIMKGMKNGRLHLVLDKLFADSIRRGTITLMDDGTASFMPSF